MPPEDMLDDEWLLCSITFAFTSKADETLLALVDPFFGIEAGDR